MKIKVTATITAEVEVNPDDYAELGIENPPRTEVEMIAYEKHLFDTDYDNSLYESVLENGKLSDFKIEKLEDTAAPAAEEAA